MELALHVARTRRPRRLWARCVSQEVLTRQVSDFDDGLWTRITSEPAEPSSPASPAAGQPVIWRGRSCPAPFIPDENSCTRLSSRNVFDLDQIEEDLARALDDLELEAHQCHFRSRSALSRMVRRCAGFGDRSREDLAQPLLDHEDSTSASLLTAKRKFIETLRTSLGHVNEMDSCEAGFEVGVLSRQVQAALAAVTDAHTPRSLVSVIRDIRRLVPFEVDPLEDNPLLSAYMCSLRIRWCYFFMFALITALALFSGEITEVFFAVFAVDPAQSDGSLLVEIRVWFMFWLLPFAVIVLALVGDQMSDLVLDASDRPPLIWSVSIVLAAIHRDRKWAPAEQTCEMVDLWVLFLTEGLPIVNATRCYFLGSGFWHGYMQGGLFSAFIATGITLTAEVAICVHDVKHSSAHKALRHIYHVLDKHKMFPGVLSSRYEVFRTHFQHVSSPDIGFGGCRAWLRPFLDAGRALKYIVVHGLLRLLSPPRNRAAMLTLLIWTLTSVLALHGLPVVATAVVMMATVSIFSIKMTMQFPKVAGPFYNIVLVFFLCVAAGLEAGTALFATTAGHITPLMVSRTRLEADAGARGRGLPSVWLGNASTQVPYAACRIPWGSMDAPLSMIDVAALAWIVYEPDCSTMAELLSESFSLLRRSAPTLEHCTPYDVLPRWASFYFPPSRRGGDGTRVFAVKGTSTWRDIYTDTKLFATIQVLQAFSKVVPILSLLPLRLVQTIVGQTNTRGGERHLWEDLEEVVRRQLALGRRERVVLTGHSLGGSIAQIVAARLQLPALVFSAPGVLYSARRFGLNVEQARHVVVVMPDGDVVPRVDRHAGVVQHIACLTPDGLPASAHKCHSLEKTSCELWRVCGDARGRDFSIACSRHVSSRLLLENSP